LNFPDLEVWEMVDSCALDVADRGGTTLEEAGAMMNLTRERIRQVEVKALVKLEALDGISEMRELFPPARDGKRRLPLLTVAPGRGQPASGEKEEEPPELGEEEPDAEAG